MILGKVRIQNFKSIKDTDWVYLSKSDLITILAGQNESGKTSFLRALRFFEEGNYDTFEEEDKRIDESPRVDCTFYLTQDEYEQLKSETNSNIADYVKKNGFNFVRGDTSKDSFDSRYTYPDDLKKLVEEFTLESNKADSTEETEAEKEEENEFVPYEYFDELRPKMVFYSSFIENNLPGKAIRPELKTNQAIQDFETIYEIDFDELMDATTTDKKRRTEEERVKDSATETLNKYWNQIISGESVEYKYSITINSQQSDPAKSSVNFYIRQGDEAPLSISQKSQGFQWFAGFNLRLRAHEKRLEEHHLILLIDEPGQGLHEVAQQDVKNVLEELARESHVQIIYSTHQPILLGKEHVEFSRLLLVDRDRKKGSTFKTISALVSSKGSLDALAPIRSALGMVTLTDPLSGKNTLIVEGITEYYYLKAIISGDYVIVPSAGVDQTPNIFGILYGWGVPTKILVDDDTQGTKASNRIKKSFFNDNDDDIFKKTVFKPTGKKGVEEFLSETTISGILSDYNQTYDPKLSKGENVEKIGKFIFAKAFYDKYSVAPDSLDVETQGNFNLVKSFITGE